MTQPRTCKVSTAQFGECWLPAGHQGDHEAQTSKRSWPRCDRRQMRAEGWIPGIEVEEMLNLLEMMNLLGRWENLVPGRMGTLERDTQALLAEHGRIPRPTPETKEESDD